MRKKNQNGGIALLEVIIALTVFSLVVLGLVRTFTQALATARLTDRVALAVVGLNNQMAMVLAEPPSLGDYDLPEDNTGLFFHIHTETANLSSQGGKALKNLLQVTIQANWQENSRSYHREISFLREGDRR